MKEILLYSQAIKTFTKFGVFLLRMLVVYGYSGDPTYVQSVPFYYINLTFPQTSTRFRPTRNTSVL